jgi:hypothetical protein
VVRKVNRIDRPDLDAQTLQREYRCTVSDMPVNDAGLDGQDVQGAEIVLVLVLVLVLEVKRLY